MNEAARPQKLLPNILLGLAVAGLLVGGAEGSCRLLERLHPAPERAPYLWNWEERWDGEFYTVGPPGTGWPPWEDVNADGVRDRSHPGEKLPDALRVAFVGDSVTMGAGLAMSEAYPHVLESRLTGLGRGIEVFNFALWGWSTRQQRIAYERLARKYRVDQLVLAVCLNDVAELQNNLSRPPRWISALHERSALVRSVVNAAGREIRSVEQLFDEPDSETVQEGWRLFFAEVRALKAEVAKDGASFAIVVFPFRFQVASGAPPPVAQQRIAEFCAAEGLPCLDVLPKLAAAGEVAFLDYDHLSPAGSRVVAEAILESGLLPERPSSPVTLVGKRPDTGDPAAAVRGFAQALRADPNPSVRAEAARALGALGAPRSRPAVPALFEALRDTSETVRWRAAQALWRSSLAAPDDVPQLSEQLESPDPYVRAFAAWTLGNMGPAAKDAVPALIAALEKEDAFLRSGAALALAKMGAAAKQALPLLVEGLKSPDHQRRRSAARALGKIGPEARGALPDLIIALGDEDQRVRAQAARALGRLGPTAREAIPALTRAREDKDPAVRREAEDALRRIQKAG